MKIEIDFIKKHKIKEIKTRLNDNSIIPVKMYKIFKLN